MSFVPELTPDQRKTLVSRGFPPPKWIQEQVVGSLISGQDTLALLPTGTGKSLCFQAPAILLKKPTLVISPLLALMQDQVDQLRTRGIQADFWSSLTTREGEKDLQSNLLSSKTLLLYVSPEKLASHKVFETLLKVRWGVLAVDEAHCVTTWGETFRPHYQTLGAKLEELKKQCHAPRFACTATARESSIQKLSNSLLLDDPRLVAVPNLRPNLSLAIVQTPNQAALKQTLFRLLQEWWETGTGSALVYVSTRLSSESTALWLQKCGLPAQSFHAGLPAAEKLKRLNHFCSQKRSLFVATCALGMGVDQPEVRLVIHAESPTEVESYVQEVGRAGRDGMPARGIWLYERAQFMGTVEDRKSKAPHLWKELRQSALHIMKLAQGRMCITQYLQEAFAGDHIPGNCLWQCECNRCKSNGWIIRPDR